MAVPIGIITLQDVCLEIYGSIIAGQSLNQCFLDANASGFDPTYEGSKDRLSNFQNYNHVTWTQFYLYNKPEPSFGDACEFGSYYDVILLEHNGTGTTPSAGDTIRKTDGTIWNGANKFWLVQASPEYSILVDSVGLVIESEICSAPPTTPCPPTITNVTDAGSNLNVYFTLGTGAGCGTVNAITSQTSTDGVNWGGTNTSSPVSPRAITDTGATQYIRLRAQTSAGSSEWSNVWKYEPAVPVPCCAPVLQEPISINTTQISIGINLASSPCYTSTTQVRLFTSTDGVTWGGYTTVSATNPIVTTKPTVNTWYKVQAICGTAVSSDSNIVNYIIQMSVLNQSASPIRSKILNAISGDYQDVFMTPNKQKFLILSRSSVIQTYSMSTPGDISTASLISSYDYSSSSDDRRAFGFSADGMKMYVTSDSGDNRIGQFNLTTAYTPSSSMTFVGDVLVPDGNPRGFNISDDGTKVWVLGYKDGKIFEITLSTPWLITSGTVTKTYTGLAGDTYITFEWVNNGYTIFAWSTIADRWFQFNATTPYDINTLSVGNSGAQITSDTRGSFYIPNTSSIILINEAGGVLGEYTY